MFTTQKLPNGRGCGERVSGKPYLCTGTSPVGLPIENFIIDPPIKWDLEGHTRSYYITTDKNGINHIVIFIGREYYPSPWSFIEEARYFGVSRRISEKFPFEKLTPNRSKMIFAHAYAIPEYLYVPVEHPQNCKIPTRPINGIHNDLPCTFVLRDLAIFHEEHQLIDDKYVIQLPSLSYEVTPPIVAYIDEGLYNINVNFQPKQVEGGLELYPQDQLHNAKTTYNKHYGCFLATTITHVEGKDYLSPEVEQKLKDSRIPSVILDY